MTIYLERDLETRAKAAAKARGLSVSHWVAQLIEQHSSAPRREASDVPASEAEPQRRSA
ncbi:hypothetical protein HUS23_04770 [Ectothiorhodospiraceae bacterium 2226]|nr:hypothetical protein HUS23_04770 [Ectothiorhodospiraceae bacterium 2226]